MIGLVRSIVIARLLVPEDFGLFGMALTVMAGLTALTTIGLDQSIVAHKFADTKRASDAPEHGVVRGTTEESGAHAAGGRVRLAAGAVLWATEAARHHSHPQPERSDSGIPKHRIGNPAQGD